MKKVSALILFLMLFVFSFNIYAKDDLKQLQEKCNAGDMSACFNLGVMYSDGKGVKQDYFKAVELYKKACDGGDNTACFNLGISYYNGFGTKKDKQKALEMFGKACDMKDQDGCDKYAKLKQELNK